MKALVVAAVFGALQVAFLVGMDGQITRRPLFPHDVLRLASLAAVLGLAYGTASASRRWLGALNLGALTAFGLFEVLHAVGGSPVISKAGAPSILGLVAVAAVTGHFVAFIALGWTSAWEARSRPGAS